MSASVASGPRLLTSLLNQFRANACFGDTSQHYPVQSLTRSMSQIVSSRCTLSHRLHLKDSAAP